MFDNFVLALKHSSEEAKSEVRVISSDLYRKARLEPTSRD